MQQDEQTLSSSKMFLKSGANMVKYLNKCCSCGQPKQNFFKYFSTQPSEFEKMSITNDVYLLLVADELNLIYMRCKCPRLAALRKET